MAYSQPRPRGRPALHHQDDGGQDAVARRDHHRDHQPDHRSHREEARGGAAPRLRAQLHQAGRVRSSSSTSRTACAPPRCRTSGIRCARRSATSARTCRRASTAPTSTTSSATPIRIIYALTTDGFSRREVRDYAERIRTELLRVPDVAKVDLIGVQDEKIYLEFSTQQIAALGLDINALAQALQAQNAVAPSGVVEAGPERIAIRISGGFTSEESLKAINFTLQRPLLPPERYRQGPPRLCRPAAAVVPLQRRAGHRARRRHGCRRRRTGARQERRGARRAHHARSCRSAST